MRVAVPSYRRADTLCSSTLPLLARLGVADEDVSVFVTPSDRPAYARALAGRGYRLEDAEPGMCAVRRSIQAWAEQGERLVQIDDDIRDLVVRIDAQHLRPATADDWAQLVATAWRACDAHGARLWGVYPVANPYFMRGRVRTGLVYVGGGLFGIQNDRRPLRSVTLDQKEDFERSLQHYVLDGAVVRVEWAAFVTRYDAGAGGMREWRTLDAIEADAMALVARYPDLCQLKWSKSRPGHTEVSLRDRRQAVEVVA